MGVCACERRCVASQFGYVQVMTQVFREVPDTALKLSPEERLAFTAALDLSLDDETRVGAKAIARGDCVTLDSTNDLKGFLDGCLADARKEIEANSD